MESIYSKIDQRLICSYIFRKDINEYRSDLSPVSEILQCCARKLKGGTFVAPHKHLPIERITIGTQEAWVVVEGLVLATVYDINDSCIAEIELNSGSCMIFFNGGHSLTAIENNTIFYEFKNGPYYGFDTDKHNI